MKNALGCSITFYRSGIYPKADRCAPYASVRRVGDFKRRCSVQIRHRRRLARRLCLETKSALCCTRLDTVYGDRRVCTRLQGKQMLAHFSISPCIINNKHTEFREKKSGSYRVCLRVNIRVFLFISKRSLGLLLLFRKNHANICYPCGRV